jgi:hypothetical protein
MTRARSGASTRNPSRWTGCRSLSRCFQSHIAGGIHYFFFVLCYRTQSMLFYHFFLRKLRELRSSVESLTKLAGSRK